MIPININFLKSQQTVGELRKVVMEAQSPKVNNSLSSKGDTKFVARERTKHFPLVNKKVSMPLPSHPIQPLMPQTFNYTKINNARRNLEWQKAQKELGIAFV